MATDVTIEFRHGVSLALQSFEAIIFLLALAGFAFHWWQMTAARNRSHQLDRELAEARAEVTRWAADARRWNQEAQDVLQGLGAAIDRQFERWGLTDAEREVARSHADVERPLAGTEPDVRDRPPAPGDVGAEREDAVEPVVPRRDPVEHLRDPAIVFG